MIVYIIIAIVIYYLYIRKEEFEGKGSIWNKVGIVYSQDKNEDSMYKLYEMTLKSGGYRYRVNDGYLMIRLNKGKKMRRLESGDIIKINTKEFIGDFVVDIR